MIEFVEEFEGRFRKQYEACGDEWTSARLRKVVGNEGWVMYDDTRTHERFIGFVDGKKALAPSVPQVCPQPIESAPRGIHDLIQLFAEDQKWHSGFWHHGRLRWETESGRELKPTHWLSLSHPGEVSPQVCPNCEELRQALETWVDLSELGVLPTAEFDPGHVNVRLALDETHAALSTLKSKEPHK